MDNFLKGNYVVEEDIVDTVSNKKNEYEEKAKNSIGGSMVFLEKNKMIWTGDKEQEIKN